MDETSWNGPSLLESLWRYRVVVLAVAGLAGVLGYVVADQQPPSYDASATLFLTNPSTTPGIEQTSPSVDLLQHVPQQAARARSRAVLASAEQALGPEAAGVDIEQAVTVEADAAELSLTISATAGTAERAAAIANAVAEAYMALNEQSAQEAGRAAVEEIRATIADLDAQLDALDQQLRADPTNIALQSQIQSLSNRLVEQESNVARVQIGAGLRGDGVDLVERAQPPDSPARPQPALAAITAAFLAAVGSSIWAFWYAGKSQRVLLRGDPEPVLGVPLLGEIPLYRINAKDPLTGLLRVDPAAAEAYEFVLSSIEFALSEMGGKSLLVTSTLPGDGKTTTTLQLAIAASRDRRRVVLVDADIRARGLTQVLGAQDRIGLSDLASLDLQPSDVMRRYRFSEQSQIPVVTAGQRRADPAALLRTHAFRHAMSSINRTAELLIIDSSPLLAVADATIVAGSADGMVIVVSRGTPVSELQKVRERLKFVSTPLLGYIFNRSEASTAAAYGYGYGLAEDDDGERRLLPKRRSRPSPGRDARLRAAPEAGGAGPPPTRGADGSGEPDGQTRRKLPDPGREDDAPEDGLAS